MSESRVRENRTHGSIGGRWRHGTNPAGPLSRAGALRNATTTARSGPQPQQRTVKPAAYLTAVPGRRVSDEIAGDGWVVDGNYGAVRDLMWPLPTRS